MIRRSSISLLSVALAALLGCAAGAPPGFSAGESWAFPLVGPLEDGALLTPVMVQGHGPYLFLLDPDAAVSSIDADVARELDLHTTLGPRMLDESDTFRPSQLAEVPALTLGTLVVRGKTFTTHPPGTFDTEGRHVRGVLGRDVIADSLVFGFDRDAGMAYLATREAFTAPASAIRVDYREEKLRGATREIPTELAPGGSVPRRLAKVTINGVTLAMHLDLGAVPSQLRPARWGAAKLAPVPYKVQLVDEVGTPRQIDKAGIANKVAAGGATAMGLSLVPFADKRWDEEDIDGALGLDFFTRYVVWADWHAHAFYLSPREGEDDRRQPRLARWAATELEGCKDPACTTARLASATAAGADGPLPQLEVARDPRVADLSFEVLLEAINAEGQPLGLPRLVASFPRGARAISKRLPAPFAGALFRVLDVSPFVRVCPTATAGCVFELRS